MRLGWIVILLAGCGIESSTPPDLLSNADLAAPLDLAIAGDLGVEPDLAAAPPDLAIAGALLCAKYGPPNLPPFLGAQYGVDYLPKIEDTPAPMGGDIVDGTYVITSNTDYGYGNSKGTPDFRSLLIVEAGAWFYRIEFSGVDDGRFAGGRHIVDQNARTIVFGNRLCGGGGQPESSLMHYSATGTTLKTYLDQPEGPGQPHTIKEIVYTRQ